MCRMMDISMGQVGEVVQTLVGNRPVGAGVVYVGGVGWLGSC